MKNKIQKISCVFSYMLMFVLLIFTIFMTNEEVMADDTLLGKPYIDITFDTVAKENSGHGTLNVFGPSDSGYYRNSSINYGFNDDGTYMEWTAGTTRGGGFNLNVDKAIGEEYTIALKFSFTNTGETSGGWKKIIDFQKPSPSADSGLYFYAYGKTQFYPSAAQGPQIKNNQVVDLLIRRNKETKKFEVYNRVGNDSILCYEFTDTNGLSILDAGLGFFHDDSATTSESSPGGKVYSVKIWDSWASVEEVWDFLDEERDAIVYYYKYINGSNEKLSFEGDGDFSFIVDGDALLFGDVTIGGITFERGRDYKISRKQGTKIEFTDKGITKLNTLTKGDYEITVTYTNSEEVTGTITLEKGPIDVAVSTSSKMEYFYEGVSKTDDESVIYDSVNHTLTLDNYNGGPISYYADDDLTIILKGTNVITSDLEDDGIFSKNSNLIITGDGTLTINNAKNGIFSGDGISIESGNITINDVKESGINSGDSLTINGGKTIINSDAYGLYATNSIDINDGYLEVNTKDDKGIALYIESSNLNSLDISSSLEGLPKNISKQNVLVTPDNINVVTLGESGASISLGDSNTDIEATNVLSGLKIYTKKEVTFNSNGGSDVEFQDIMYGFTSGEPITPTKEGYTFKGWYEDATLVVPFDFDTEITGDVTLYAKWELATYTITVEANDDSFGSSTANVFEAIMGTNITLQNIANAGYHFVRWESEDVDASTGKFEMPGHNVTVIAVFEANELYKISFVTNGGDGSMEEIEIDPITDQLPDCTFDAPLGKQFSGWSLSQDGEVIDSPSKITSDSTLYAIWEDYYDYRFLSGDNQELELGDINNYTFRISGDYSLFESVKVGDLDLVKDEDYIVTEGSTIITFTKKGIAKLNKLIKGEYEVLVTYTNSKTVTGKVFLNGNVLNPETNDNIYLYVIIGIISLLGLLFIYCKRKSY